MARQHYADGKPPQPYSPYREHDVRYQYPRIISRPQIPHQPSYQSGRVWPPSPKAEDESLALSREHRPVWSDTSSEEAQSRGIIDQQPIILDVDLPGPKYGRGVSGKLCGNETDSPSDSNESSGPETPESSDDRNQDQRYVYIPKEGIEIPLTYDEAREPKYIGKPHSQEHPPQVRGRAERPRVDTDIRPQSSLQPDTTPRERARSPYAFKPQSKPKEDYTSGQHLLSPEAIAAPSSAIPSSQREPSRRRQAIREPSHGPRPADDTTGPEPNHTQSASGPSRPTIARHASAAAYPGEPVTPVSVTSRHMSYYLPSERPEESHHESSKYRDRHTSTWESLESPRKVSSPIDRDRTPKSEKRLSSGLRPVSPPPRAQSAVDERALPRHPIPSALPLQAANVLLQNVYNGQRRASPRASPVASPAGSPTHSPFASPPRTPPSERNHAGDQSTRTRQAAISQTPSSPLTPIHTPQTPKTPSFLFSDSEHERPSRRYAPKSRRTSPLPSPAPTASFGPQIDIRAPSPGNHQKSFSDGIEETKPMLYDSSRHPSLAPFDTQPSALKPPTFGQRRRASSSTDVRPQFANNLTPLDVDKISRSPSRSRRPTLPGRAVSVGALPTALPPCPRPCPVSGYNDWYTLVGGLDAFTVCPTCRDAIAYAGFERYAKPKSRIADYDKIRCDFSLPWVRMAWTSSLNKRHRDMELLYEMADIVAHEPPCPGKVEDVREWYRLIDTETGKSVPDFQVCPQCVRSLETMHPTLRGVFHRSHGHRHRSERTCSMRTDSKRFMTYIDLLTDTAKQAEEYRRPPNMFRFVDLAHRIAGIPECSRDDMLLDQEWYIIPNLPELTVCEDCYEEAVWPAIKRNSPIAIEFKRHPKFVAPSHVGVSCQLYSPRMRKIFQEACQRDDMHILKNAAIQRYRVEKDLQARNAEVQKWPKEERIREVARLVEEWKRWE